MPTENTKERDVVGLGLAWLAGVFLAGVAILIVTRNLPTQETAAAATQTPPQIHAGAYLKTPPLKHKDGSIPLRPVPPSLITSTALPAPTVSVPEKTERTMPDTKVHLEASSEEINMAERAIFASTWPANTNGARIVMAKLLWKQFPRIYQATGNDPYDMPFDELKKEFYMRMRTTTHIGPRVAELPDPAASAGP